MMQLFKMVASILAAAGNHEWAPGNWSFACMDDLGYSGVIAELDKMDDPDRLCDFFINGVTSDELGGNPELSISAAEMQSGRRILIYKEPSQLLWTFLQPFEWRVWLMIFGSSVVVALSVLFLEWTWHHGYSLNQAPSASQAWRAYSSIQWGVTGQALSSIYQLAPRSPGARVVILTSSFAALILALAYASAYTSTMTMRSILINIQSSGLKGLQNLPVGVWDEDYPAISSLGVLNRIVLLPWNNMGVDVQRMIEMLRNRTISALLIDSPFVSYMSSSTCDLFQVGPLILPTDMGIVFAAGTPPSYALIIDSALSQLQGSSVASNLQNKFLVFTNSSCHDKAETLNPSQHTQLADVGGLWIILAGCIAIGLIWNLTSFPMRRLISSRSARPPYQSPSIPSLTTDEVKQVSEAAQIMASKAGQLPASLISELNTQMDQLRDELLTIVKYASKFTSNVAARDSAQQRFSSNRQQASGSQQHASDASPGGYMRRH